MEPTLEESSENRIVIWPSENCLVALINGTNAQIV